MSVVDLARMSFGPIISLILFFVFLWGSTAIALHFLKKARNMENQAQIGRYIRIGRSWLSIFAIVIFGVYLFKLSTMNVIDNKPIDRGTVIEQQQKYDQ
jgi:hypothetical protein